MKIYGLDFTSAPDKRKPITCVACTLNGNVLCLEMATPLTSFDSFEAFLAGPGPWVAGMDFPFGQPRRLIENIGWPAHWEGYVHHVAGRSKAEFIEALKEYRQDREKGDKQHLRYTDELAASRSPMMLYGVPVGKMFFEGAPRLLKSGACILPCRPTADPRIILEAYPALVARRWIGKASYKTDNIHKRTVAQREARERIVQGLRSETKIHFGFEVQFSPERADEFIQDGSGDTLDAFLCAIQASWAYLEKTRNYGIPVTCDLLEGWIVDPGL